MGLRELSKQTSEVSRDLSILRSQLNEADQAKEKTFSELKGLRAEIREKVERIKELKAQRNSLTGEVKALKEERKTLNDLLKEKISKVREVNEEKKRALKKSGITADLISLKKDIEALENRIETQVMSHSKEKELMKLINEKRKLLAETGGAREVIERAHAVSKEADEARKKADEAHKEIQRKAEESQKKHEQINSLSKELSELRKKEQELLKAFDEQKARFNGISDKMNEKLSRVGRISSQIKQEKEAGAEKSRKKDAVSKKKVLMDKVAEVEKKLKKGEKLTTEDLLVMQSE